MAILRKQYWIALLVTLVQPVVTSLANAGSILVVRKNGPAFLEVKEGVAVEIDGDHTLVDYIISEKTKYEAFVKKVKQTNPDLMLLMDNQAVTYGIKYNQDKNKKTKLVPGVAAMGLNLKKYLSDIRGMSGITYEVPGLTLITRFRYIVNQPLKRILTFYRGSEFSDLIADTKAQLKREKIELLAMDVEKEGKDKKSIVKFLDENLKETVNGKKVDGVLVLNDNALLNPETFGPIWVARAREFKVPFLCGIENFALRKLDFCTYAASPNHKALGQQVAEQILTIIEDGEEDVGVEYILSVVQTLNLERAMKIGLKVNPATLGYVQLGR